MDLCCSLLYYYWSVSVNNMALKLVFVSYWCVIVCLCVLNHIIGLYRLLEHYYWCALATAALLLDRVRYWYINMVYVETVA